MRLLLFSANAKRPFWLKYMDNFKFNFLSRIQLNKNFSLDTIFLPLLKILPCCEVFLGNFAVFAIIAGMFCGNNFDFHYMYNVKFKFTP